MSETKPIDNNEYIVFAAPSNQLNEEVTETFDIVDLENPGKPGKKTTTYYRMCTLGEIFEKYHIVSPQIYNKLHDKNGNNIDYYIPDDIANKCVTFGEVKSCADVLSIVLTLVRPKEEKNFDIYDYFTNDLNFTKDQYVYTEQEDVLVGDKYETSSLTYIYSDIDIYHFNGRIGQLPVLKKNTVDHDDYFYNFSENNNLCRLRDITYIPNTFRLTVMLFVAKVEDNVLSKLFSFSKYYNDSNDMRNAKIICTSNTTHSPYTFQYNIISGNAIKFRMDGYAIDSEERVKFSKWNYSDGSEVVKEFLIDDQHRYIESEYKDIEKDFKISITPEYKKRVIIYVYVQGYIQGGSILVFDKTKDTKGNDLELPVLTQGQKSTSYTTTYYNPTSINFTMSIDKEHYKSADYVFKATDGSGEIKGSINNNTNFTASLSKSGLQTDKSYILEFTMEEAYKPYAINFTCYPASRLIINGTVYKYKLYNKIVDSPVYWDSSNNVFTANDAGREGTYDEYSCLIPKMMTDGHVYYTGKVLMEESYNNSLEIKFDGPPTVNLLPGEDSVGWSWEKKRKTDTIQSKNDPLNYTRREIIPDVQKGDKVYLKNMYNYRPVLNISIEAGSEDIRVINSATNDVIINYGNHDTAQIVADSTNFVSFVVQIDHSINMNDKFNLVYSIDNEVKDRLEDKTVSAPYYQYTYSTRIDINDSNQHTYTVLLSSVNSYVEKKVIVSINSADINTGGYLCGSGEKYEGVYQSATPNKVYSNNTYQWTYTLKKGVIIPLIYTFDNSETHYANGQMTASQYYKGIHATYSVNVGTTDISMPSIIPGLYPTNTYGAKKSRIRNKYNIASEEDNAMTYGYSVGLQKAVSESYTKPEGSNTIAVEYDFGSDSDFYKADTIYINVEPTAMDSYTYYVQVANVNLLELYTYETGNESDDSNNVTNVPIQNNQEVSLKTSLVTPTVAKLKIVSQNINLFGSFKYTVTSGATTLVSDTEVTINSNLYAAIKYDGVADNNVKFNIFTDISSKNIFIKVVGSAGYDFTVQTSSGAVSCNRTEPVKYGMESTFSGNMTYSVNFNGNTDFTNVYTVKVLMCKDAVADTKAAESKSWVEIDSTTVNKNSSFNYKYGYKTDSLTEVMTAQGYKSVMLEFSLEKGKATLSLVNENNKSLIFLSKKTNRHKFSVVAKYQDSSIDDKSVTKYTLAFNGNCTVLNSNGVRVGTLNVSNPTSYFGSNKNIANSVGCEITITTSNVDFFSNFKLNTGAAIPNNCTLQNFLTISHSDCSNKVNVDFVIQEPLSLTVRSTYGYVENQYDQLISYTFIVTDSANKPYTGEFEDIGFTYKLIHTGYPELLTEYLNGPQISYNKTNGTCTLSYTIKKIFDTTNNNYRGGCFQMSGSINGDSAILTSYLRETRYLESVIDITESGFLLSDGTLHFNNANTVQYSMAQVNGRKHAYIQFIKRFENGISYDCSPVVINSQVFNNRNNNNLNNSELRIAAASLFGKTICVWVYTRNSINNDPNWGNEPYNPGHNPGQSQITEGEYKNVDNLYVPNTWSNVNWILPKDYGLGY